jgi:hypothetical protein
MWNWIVINKQWVFSGAGLSILAAALWFFRKLLFGSPVAPASVQTNTNSVNQSPVFTFNVGLSSPPSEPKPDIQTSSTLPAPRVHPEPHTEEEPDLRYKNEGRETTYLARQQQLIVLVWGPGDPGDFGSPEAKEAYGKRCLIRDVLRDMFPQSDIAFSRENQEILGQTDKLTLDAFDADAVIILDMSRGPHLELGRLTKFPWFLEKLWLLERREYPGEPSLVAKQFKLIPQDQVQGFTDEEFRRSDVARIMSVKAVTTVAVRKLLRR